MTQATHCTPANGQRHAQVQVPRADVREAADAYHFELELPGVDPKTVAIEFERGVLKIAAEAPALAVEGLELAYREFDTGAFERSFKIPEGVDADAISAEAKNGVLLVRVPKKTTGPKKIEVRAG
ncbi:MAG: Hsp20/alpha crystallin family protein [Planctomycetes bacterium]|nr:Hsp20/alpha crystallin family protein [Planctomycetota bacterium]